MAIIFDTSDPSGLLRVFKKAIDDRHVVTWRYDVDGDFVHTPPQWSQVGWLQPHLKQGQLVFTFLGRTSQTTTKENYAVYHGRFVESMLAHCDLRFSEARTTALPSRFLGDAVSVAA